MRPLQTTDTTTDVSRVKMSAVSSEITTPKMQTIRKGDKIMKYIKLTSSAMASMFFFVLLGLLPEPAHATRACCQINANGTPRFGGSFRCNLSSLETRRLALGLYEVDSDRSLPILETIPDRLCLTPRQLPLPPSPDRLGSPIALETSVLFLYEPRTALASTRTQVLTSAFTDVTRTPQLLEQGLWGQSYPSSERQLCSTT